MFKGKWYKWEDKEEVEKEMVQTVNNKESAGNESQASWYSEDNDKQDEDLE